VYVFSHIKQSIQKLFAFKLSETSMLSSIASCYKKIIICTYTMQMQNSSTKQ